MMVFIVGISGGIGALLARTLSSQGHLVTGLVRRRAQQADLQAQGVDVIVGDLSTMIEADLARSFGQADAIVFTAGSNGGSREVTTAIDGAGVRKAMAAAGRAGVDRFVLVSVLPEAWRERDLGDEVEHYFSVKKEADVAVSRSDTLAILIQESRISRQILELTAGPTLIKDAVQLNLPRGQAPGSPDRP